jgi:hypothetical protein
LDLPAHDFFVLFLPGIVYVRPVPDPSILPQHGRADFGQTVGVKARTRMWMHLLLEPIARLDDGRSDVACFANYFTQRINILEALWLQT